MKFTVATLLFSLSLAHASNQLQFDKQGDFVKPDLELVKLGLKYSKKGNQEVAMKSFKKAAKYGNYYAITLIAAAYIKQQEYAKALAWLQLIDLNHISQKEIIAKSLDLLENGLSPEQLQVADQLHKELLSTYGHQAAFKHRERWRNSLKFTGTNIRGKVPQNLKFTYKIGDGGADQHTFTVSGQKVESQLHQFVYEYEFDFPTGEVILGPIDLQD